MCIHELTSTQLAATIGAAIGAVSGALVSGIFILINQWLTRRSDERRQRRELAFNLALAYWQRDRDFGKFRSENNLGSTNIAPLDWYIFRMIKLSELVDKNPNWEEFVSTWKADHDATERELVKEIEGKKETHG